MVRVAEQQSLKKFWEAEKLNQGKEIIWKIILKPPSANDWNLHLCFRISNKITHSCLQNILETRLMKQKVKQAKVNIEKFFSLNLFSPSIVFSFFISLHFVSINSQQNKIKWFSS